LNQYVINKNAGNTFLGIDIGGTRIKAGLVTSKGKIISQESKDTLSWRGKEAVLQDLKVLIKKIISGPGKNSVRAIGIGICGPTDFETGTLITSPILENWDNVPIAEIIRKDCNIPVLLDNDANLAVFGETWVGAAQGMKNVVGFTLGTGVGGGIIIDGNIYRGRHFYAAELGHMTVIQGGMLCACGNRGCLTVEASIKATIERFQRETGTKELVTVEQILQQSRRGHKPSLNAVMPMVEAIAVGIANVMNIFDPDCIVISGGPTKSGNWLLNLILDKVKGKVFHGLFRGSNIVFSKLHDLAGVIGGAGLAYKVYN
jgi:glucokinase